MSISVKVVDNARRTMDSPVMKAFTRAISRKVYFLKSGPLASPVDVNTNMLVVCEEKSFLFCKIQFKMLQTFNCHRKHVTPISWRLEFLPNQDAYIVCLHIVSLTKMCASFILLSVSGIYNEPIIRLSLVYFFFIFT